MKLTSIKINNFRCFASKILHFDSKVVHLLGPNGIGKTSILEAIYYSCYLRSFKTHIPKELINIDANSFSIITNINGNFGQDIINVGLENLKKFAKVNQKPITSFKEIYEILKVLSITQNDISIIEGSPIFRRSFIDQFIVFFDSEYLSLLSKFNKILKNRNSLLFQQKKDMDSYLLWTSELIKHSKIIQEKRINMLSIAQNELTNLGQYFNKIDDIKLTYRLCKPEIDQENLSIESVYKHHSDLINKEFFYKRTLFGAHLDDFDIMFNLKHSRIYASRGQQKLIIFLLKFALINYAHSLSSKFILLVDDFFADFDDAKSKNLLNLASELASQVFITSPSETQIIQNIGSQIQVIKVGSL